MPSRFMRALISGHSCFRNWLRSESPQPRPRARRDEHADPALDHDQAFVLEALIGLGDGQGICLLLRREARTEGKDRRRRYLPARITSAIVSRRRT